jgi:PilZ domain
MGSALDRRDRRYTFHLSGVILARKGEVLVQTGDVSFRGAFLETDTPPQMRQLVRVRLAMPLDFEPEGAERALVATGMVAHVVKPGDPRGRRAGAGIEFYGLDGELRSRWERLIQFIQHRASSVPAAHGRGADPAQPPPRVGTQLDVHLMPSAEAVATGDSTAVCAQDISEGQMFIRTNVPLSVGAGLVVNLIDPTSLVGFPIDCVVRRREFGSKAGVLVEFLEMPLATWLALVEFLKPPSMPGGASVSADRSTRAEGARVELRAS